MNVPKLLQKTGMALLLALCVQTVTAQVRIEGTVYDQTQQFPLPGVSVQASSGAGTITDSTGHYGITLAKSDSIYFSYLGKLTAKFAVRRIEDPTQFNMSLDLPVDALPTVLVNPKSYRLDSLENRREYQKLFDFDRASVMDNMKAGRGRSFGVGFDMDMMFDGKRNKRMEGFQQFLVNEEHDKYVDHRFTRALVRRLTGLEPPALDTFMVRYRPTYEYTVATSSDWDFYEYIRDTGKFFAEMWKEEHPAVDSTKTSTATGR